MSLIEQRVGIPHHQAGMGFKYKHGWIPLTEEDAYNQQLHKSIQKSNKTHRPKGKGLRPEDVIDAGTAQYQKDAKLLPAAEKYRKLATKHRELAANAKTAHQREMALMRAKALEGAVSTLEAKAKASSFKLRNDELRYDISPLGTGKNWVTEVGGLPTMVRAIAHALIRHGSSESHAIATAIAALRRWAAGGGGVHPSTRARAVAALAEWEAKKLAAHATPNKRAQVEAILERRFNPSQARTPSGGPGGGQWASAASGGGPPAGTKVQNKKLKAWSAKQIGHYPPGMIDPKQRQEWDNWFRFFAATTAEQKSLAGKGKAPKASKAVKDYLKAQHSADQAAQAQASYNAMVAQARLTLSGG